MKKKKNHEPTNSDILEAINQFATHVEERFNGVEKRLDRVESDMVYVKSVMVTKDYLDDKLADLTSDLGMLIRKEDKKVNNFIRVVRQKKVISSQEAGSLLATGPFSKSN